MKYVVSHRRADSATTNEDAAKAGRLRQRLSQLPPALRDRVEHAAAVLTAGRHVAFLECEEADVTELRAILGADVIVEPIDPRTHQGAENAAASSLRLTVRNDGEPVPGISVTLVTDPPSSQVVDADDGGVCAFVLTDDAAKPDTLFTESKAGMWSALTKTISDGMEFDLPKLMPSGPVEWWHDVVGVGFNPKRGAGIRIGLVDGGVGTHASLRHVQDLGAIVDGQLQRLPVANNDHHGTMSAGLIGARPSQTGDVAGMAPGADIVAVSVFGPDGAHQADVSLAIDLLVEASEVDIINLSLTGERPSELEADAIAFAWDRGVVCVCAAGNSGGPVLYPAAFPSAVSVTALGRRGWGPDGSVVRAIDEAVRDYGRDGLYLAPFSSRGVNVTCSAPGVGLVGPFPGSQWGEDSGTSLAAPVATGVLAGLLADDTAYRGSERNASRSARARSILEEHCVDISLPREAQGHGLLRARPGSL